MENVLRARIRERLDALGLNAFEAARRAGAERTFIRDLLSGRKETIRPAALARIAEVLQCDVAYLHGQQGAPRRPPMGDGMMPIAGILEAGVWRAQEAQTPEIIPLLFDPRFPPERQAAYLVRGHHADGLGIRDGDVVLALVDGPPRDGDIVIARRVRAEGEMELAARLVEGDELRARAGVSLQPKVSIQDCHIVARVIAGWRIFQR